MLGKKKIIGMFLALSMILTNTICVYAENTMPDEKTNVPEGTFSQSNEVMLSDYISQTEGEISKSGNSVTLSKKSGDHHAIATQNVMYKSFIYEADVQITDKEENGAAGLSLYRNKNSVTSDGWFAANLIPNENKIRFFRVNANNTLVDNFGKNSSFNGFEGENHLRLKVETDGRYNYTLTSANGTSNELTGTIDGWYGAYLGLLTFNSKATFSNIKVTDLSNEIPVYFNSTVTSITNNNGDHGEYLQAVQGRSFKNFNFETDAIVKDNGEGSGALLLGYDMNNPLTSWTGINFHKNANVTKIFGPNMEGHDHSDKNFDFSHNIHLSVSVDNNGNVIYKAIDSDGTVNGGTTTISPWNGAYLGLLTFNSEVEFYNTRIVDYNDNGLSNASGLFKTNLSELSAKSGNWDIDYNGLKGSIATDGDAILLSNTNATDFVYEADVKFNEKRGAASLVMRSNSDDMDSRYMYVANINGQTGEARLFKFEQSRNTAGLYTTAIDLANSETITLNEKGEYHLKVVAIGKHFVYYINGQLVINTADYTAENVQAETTKAHHGQNDAILEGKMGLMTWNGNVSYQNVNVTKIDDKNTPQLNNLTISNQNSDIDKQIAFMKGQYVYIGYVKNSVKNVSLNAVTSNGSIVSVKNSKGDICDIKELPVSLGENIYTLEVRNGEAKVIYKVQLYRCQPDETYYNEDYRGQYHYSVKDGWANDPNGMVYYKGVYHLFYQFYDDTTWGPMHWAHATSTDLIHWEEQPIALYPDEYGAMYSGCAVVANHDTAPEVFATGEEGIVLLITANGTNGFDGQRIIMAYSTDGVNWQKKEDAKVLLDWTEDDSDTLYEHKSAFRDPKVFRFDNKWFMVLAGGPLRIYSSDDLINWTLESAYKDLHTECPDLYPLEYTENGNKTVKWVLDRGGRYYKIGDFKQVNGKYRFVPDDNYVAPWYKDSDPNDLNRETNYKGDLSIEGDYLVDGIMNFGADYYAAMTYYVQDFGTSSDVKVPRLIAINWMNTWDDYCRDVASKTNNNVFNGTFDLQVELGLTKDSEGKYVLKQSPIKEYESLRDVNKVIQQNGITIKPNNNIYEDFNESSYEIVANLKPEEGTKEVGFNVRVGDGQKTVVKYNFETHTVSIDRSQSGILVSGKFAHVHSQSNVTTNKDGSIDLHIYVDRASVEVYTANDTVSGADQIFPNATSNGLEVFSVGGNATGNITIYPLNTIWNKVAPTKPTSIKTSKTNLVMYVYPKDTSKNDSQTVSVWTSPVDYNGDAGLTVLSDNTNVAEATLVNGKVVVNAKSKGDAVLTVSSTKYKDLHATINVIVRENSFKTNLEKLINVTGGWYINGEELINNNGTTNDIYMSAVPMHQDSYIMETDLKITRGLVNLFIASSSTNPFADNGAYAIQFNNDRNVRLFRFGVDGDLKTAVLNQSLNDNQYHHIKIVKNSDSIEIYVDNMNTAVLTHRFTNLDNYFTQNSYVGLGLWDGEVSLKNLYVTQDADYTNVNTAIAKANKLDKANYKDFSAVEKAIKAVVEGKNITEQNIVDGYATTIENAIKALEYKDADYSKVNKAIEKANKLNKEDYIDFSAVEKAITDVKKGLNITKQEEVDTMAKAIEDAIQALGFKGSMDYDIPTIDTDKPVEDVTVAVKDENKAKYIIIGSVSDTLQKKIDEIINQGIKVTTEVSIDKIDETNVSEAAKNDITEIAAYIKEENFKIAEYFDITLSIVANNKELGTVTDTTEKLVFQIAVPEELQKEGRTFKVIRIHGDEITVLDTKEENGILTFESNQFSTYALVYSDKVETTVTPNPTPNPGEETDTNKPSSGETVNTGDQNLLGLYAGIGMLSLLGVLLTRRKKEN